MVVLWKTIAKFIEEPVWRHFPLGASQGYYIAKLENKEGEFECSIGEKYLENYSEISRICFLKCVEGEWGEFKCRWIEFLNDDEETTFWEETSWGGFINIKKESKLSKKEAENQSLAEKNDKLINELVKRSQLISSLQKQVSEKEKLQTTLITKDQELAELKKKLIIPNNLPKDNQERADNLLVNQSGAVNDNWQLNKTKKFLSKIIFNEEINLLCRLQNELKESQQQKQLLEKKIEVLTKSK